MRLARAGLRRFLARADLLLDFFLPAAVCDEAFREVDVLLPAGFFGRRACANALTLGKVRESIRRAETNKLRIALIQCNPNLRAKWRGTGSNRDALSGKPWDRNEAHSAIRFALCSERSAQQRSIVISQHPHQLLTEVIDVIHMAVTALVGCAALLDVFFKAVI